MSNSRSIADAAMGPEVKNGASLTAFSSDHPLLLVTDFSPEAGGGGAVILRSLLTDNDRERIIWATLSPLDDREPRAVSLASSARRSMIQDTTIGSAALGRAAQAVMRAHHASAAWVVAHGASVRVASQLISAGVPVHLTIHDDPAGYVQLTRRYRALGPLLARDLHSALRGARSVDVVSDAMADYYRRRYDVSSVVVHRGLSRAAAGGSSYDRNGGISVAVLGSTYGSQELHVLAHALSLLAQRRQEPVRLSVIGGGVDLRRLRRHCSARLALEVTGHLDEREGLVRLRSSFLLYVNHPFRRGGRILRTTSFPTKLSTYTMAARPLLLHTPPDSAVAALNATSPYATLWSSLNPEDGAQVIERLWESDQPRSFADAAEAVRGTYFDLASNRRTLFRALNSLGSA